jgi:hypothetical protein
MTKVKAIQKVLEQNGGAAGWGNMYIEAFYPEIKEPKDWKAALRGVPYREVDKRFKLLGAGVVALKDYDESRLVLNEDVTDTTQSVEAKIRLGQERFRKTLLRLLKRCPITSIDEPRTLLASYIKPRAVSTDAERMAVFNGFIFSPTIDKLFDAGLTTFENDKRVLVSALLSKANAQRIGIEHHKKKYPALPLEGRESYLTYHRQYVFAG